MSSVMSVHGMKDQIELPFRTIRLGTLRTYPVKIKDAALTTGPISDLKTNEPLLLSEKGMKFILSLNQAGTEEVIVKISAKRIQCVHAFIGRGCPVLWIKPDQVCAERIRSICNMYNKRGPYLDPVSEADAQREIAVITAQDPLPFAVGHSIQRIFQNIAKKRFIKPEKFFIMIQHKENNDKLVQCTVFMENMENQRHGSLPIPESRKHMQEKSQKKKKHTRKDDSTSSDDFSEEYEVDDTSILTDDSTDFEFRLKAKPKMDSIYGSFSSRKGTNKVSSERAKESEMSPDKRKEILSEKKKEMHSEKKEAKRIVSCPIPMNSPQKSPSPVLSASTSPGDLPRKVHRARKSIPNRHRAVSIESQLRARIEEQTPKDKASKRDLDSSSATISHKRKHSVESEASDVSGKISGSDTPSLDSLTFKKKRAKDLSVCVGKQKKKNIPNCSESVSPSFDLLETSDPTMLQKGTHMLPLNTDSVVSRHPRPMDRKSQALNLNMKILRKDANNLLQLTPLCTCVVKSPHNLKLPANGNAKCMAVDHVDGRLYGCFNNIQQPDMFRPSSRIPVIGLCDEHRERMLRHESCPGCGTFCAGGVFLACIKYSECPHRFHRDCMVLSGRNGDCPHCGGDISNVKEVNLAPGHDEDLMWTLAGRDPAKMRSKGCLEERGKNARIGHKPALLLVPEIVPGMTELLPSGVVINVSTLAPGLQRQNLESLLVGLRDESHKKNRFQSKLFLQHVSDNDLSKVIQMLSDGFDLSLHKSTLDTALLESLPDGDLATTHVLIQAGADINSRYVNGDTPLFRALQKKNKELIFYLLTNKADVKIMDEEGMTCLHRAAMEGFIDGCHLLLRYGKADINAAGEGGYTAIMWAAEHKQVAMARYLLHYGADISSVDNEGNICLQWAALSGNIDILILCLQRSSDPNHKNTHGDTALHIAAREDNHNCISLLLSYGADSTIKNNEKDTALDCAAEKNTSWMMLKVNEWIRKAGLINKRILPFNRERVLCEDMSRGYDKVPIMCVNAIDDAPCPSDPPNGFHYVTENVHTSPDTKINYIVAAIQSCSCIDGCKASSCNCNNISEGCWYSDARTLLSSFDISEPPLIFECHKMCKCTRMCKNRVVQNGIKYRLQVFRTVGKQWGLRSLESIPRGAFVCDYVGELISDAEADLREDDSYLFDLENKDGEMYCIDARNYGNVSRFINHLCEPNLVPIRVFVDHHDIRFPKLAYFTTREIKPYEELGFDYGDRFWDVKCRQFTCQCGSPNCKYSTEAYRKKAQKEDEEKEKQDSQGLQNTFNANEEKDK